MLLHKNHLAWVIVLSDQFCQPKAIRKKQSIIILVMKMKNWKIFGVVVVIALAIVSSGLNGVADKNKPFLSKEEITDFLVSLDIDKKTVSTMNVSDIYLSDIPDGFWSWMNLSNEEGANLVKDLIHQIETNKSGALEKLMKLFPVEEQEPVYTFGPETLEELKSNPHVIAVYGKIPAFNGQRDRREWLDKLAKVMDQANEKINLSIMEKYGINMCGIPDGYIEVHINMKVVGKNMSVIKNIYKIFDESAVNTDIKDVPVVFIGNEGKLKIINCGGRTDKYRPIEGGIQVCNLVIEGPTYLSTIGYSAIRYGVRGYVVAGHLGYNFVNPTPLDTIFYQPMCALGNNAGYVTAVGGTYSDSAFVEYSNVGPYIYTVPWGFHLGIVNGYRDPINYEYLYMSGISSGWCGGEVLNAHVDVYDGPPFTVLYNQAIINLPTLPGDSGAPVLNYGREILPGLAFVRICGIVKGRIAEGPYQGAAVVSPQSGVYTDMHARPLTIG